jgi:hypothetical protein
MQSTEKVPVDTLVAQCDGHMVPITKSFSYFTAMPVEEGDLRRWLFDPIAAVPPKVGEVLPHLRFVLVPYLESPVVRSTRKSAAKSKPAASGPRGEMVTFRRPAAKRQLLAHYLSEADETFLFLAVKNQDLADYHYVFYNGLASLITQGLTAKQRERFDALVREELVNETHGEVDEASWRLKEEVLQRAVDPTRNSKALQNYFSQALIDTLTLYLHGLCCDIDIEAGPRQLASRPLRQRLQLLREILPPPKGIPLFPEEL